MPEPLTDFQQVAIEVLRQFGLRDLCDRAYMAWYEKQEVDIPLDIPEWLKLITAEGNKELKTNRQLVAEFAGVEPNLLFGATDHDMEDGYSLSKDEDDTKTLWQIWYRPDRGRCVEKY